jgi:hypothetical protein
MKIVMNLNVSVRNVTPEQLEEIRLELRRSALPFVFRSVDNALQDTNAHQHAVVDGDITIEE